MRDYTAAELKSNLERVDHLVGVYTFIVNEQTDVQGAEDVLRAAVVFLHATVEEFVRNILIWKLPKSISEEILNTIPLLGYDPNKRPEKFLLGTLVKHKGMFVDNLIYRSVKAYVNKMSVSDTTELCTNLEKIRVQTEQFKSSMPSITSLMKRRHQIVHQMDREQDYDIGTGTTEALKLSDVVAWRQTVEELLKAVLIVIPDDMENEKDPSSLSSVVDPA